MKRIVQSQQIEQQSWVDFLKDSMKPEIQQQNFFEQSDEVFIPTNTIHAKRCDKQYEKDKALPYSQEQQLTECLKRQQNALQTNQEKQDSSNQFKRGKKSQGDYSRQYRQKKKQKIKILEQENYFLKKKIDQLQNRLRQKELQLNRIKFCTKDEFSIEKLNEEVVRMLSIITSEDPDTQSNQNSEKESLIQSQKQTSDQNQKGFNILSENNQQNEMNKRRQQQFIRFYQKHGMGGQKKLQLLEYYLNQFLENVFRDREKYFCLMSVKKKYLTERTQFDIEILAATDKTEEQFKKGIAYYERARPDFLEVIKACREVYKYFQIVIRQLKKAHQVTIEQFSKQIDFTKNRFKVVAWFEMNQYRKQMRDLRAEWVDIIKGGDPEELLQQKAKGKKGYSKVKKEK